MVNQVKKKINVLIADDEKNALEILSKLLLDTGKVRSVKTVMQADQIELSLLNCEPDALFLDIEMPGRSGIEILEVVREYNNMLPVIFDTAYSKYVDQTIKHNAFSYLTKPVNRKELERWLTSFGSLIEEYNRDKQKKITVTVKNGYVYINFDSILTFTAKMNYTEITTIEG